MAILLGNVQELRLLTRYRERRRTKLKCRPNLWIVSRVIPPPPSLSLSGEKSFTEKLIVETAHLAYNGDAVSWQNLPVLTATVTSDGEEIFHPEAKINYLSITVESIYNPPDFFAEDAEYKAGTIAYIDNEVPLYTSCV